MKSVMNDARTENYSGKINIKFAQFAQDFGFKVNPCISARLRTTGKVESQMKLLDEIHAYQGKFTIIELAKYVEGLCNCVNRQIHQETAKIPLIEFEKEKSHLITLPVSSIRYSYKRAHKTVKVNASNMITYKSNQYSVSSGYYGKKYLFKLLTISYRAILDRVLHHAHVVQITGNGYRIKDYHEEI